MPILLGLWTWMYKVRTVDSKKFLFLNHLTLVALGCRNYIKRWGRADLPPIKNFNNVENQLLKVSHGL